MKVYLYLIAMILLLSQTANAQAIRTTSTQNNQAKGVTPVSQTTSRQNQKPVTMSQATDSIKYAVNDFKKSMNSIFGNKKDTIQIFVSAVEYDDANLSLLKESLKKIKGGRFVNMQYKASNAVLEISFKGTSTQLWDEIPADSKKAFKIVEANDNNLTLAVRK